MLSLVGTAAADTTAYPAPPVTVTSTVVVTSSASDAVVTSSDCACAGALPNTGAGFDIGLTLLIGGAIVLVGVLFTFMGARRLRRH
jgi:hypothetical protein